MPNPRWIEAAIAMALAGTATAAVAAPLVEPVDLARPERPQPGERDAMIVMRFHAPGMVGENRITFRPWDAAAGSVDEAEGARGFRAGFSYSVFGGSRNVRVLRVLIVPAGDYVLAARTFNRSHTDSFCLGAPVFTAAPGSVTYLGDYELFALHEMADGRRRNAMRYSARLDEARAQLAAHYPAQAAALAPWTPVNGNRFPCSGTEFTAYAVPGAPMREAAPPSTGH